MKTILVCFFYLQVITDCFSQDTISDYYKEIACKSEYSANKDTSSYEPKRWKKDVKIFVKGFPDSVVCSELDKVVSELNELIETIEIRIVDFESEANLIAYFGWGLDYDKFEPIAEPYTGTNWGLACIYTGNNDDWNHGSFYVDVVRCNDHPIENATKLKKHILREELTQSLGLLNDSIKYPESIFYNGWSMTTEFTELDKEVIRRHYRN